MTKLIVFSVIGLLALAILAFLFFSVPANAKGDIEIFHSPSCGCCKLYKSYLASKGFNIKSTEIYDLELEKVKEHYNIPLNMRSCHTLKIGNYFIEGHVPIEAIEKLLSEKPNISGIALPGMPEGSPGMSGTKQQPFVIYSISGNQIDRFTEI